MSATHYLLSVTYATKPTNKLCDDIYNDLKSKDRTLVKASDIEKLKESIIHVVDTYNSIHKRCKPVKVYWFDMEREEELPRFHLSLNGLTFMHVKVIGVKEVTL